MCVFYTPPPPPHALSPSTASCYISSCETHQIESNGSKPFLSLILISRACATCVKIDFHVCSKSKPDLYYTSTALKHCQFPAIASWPDIASVLRPSGDYTTTLIAFDAGNFLFAISWLSRRSGSFRPPPPPPPLRLHASHPRD